MKKYIIKNKHDLAGYIFQEIKDATPLKVSLLMYFLYAFHGGFYYKRYRKAKRKMSELPMLFKPSFKAEPDGPYDTDIEKAFKEDFYNPYINGEKTISIREVLGNPPYRTDSIESLISDFTEKVKNVSDEKLKDRAVKDRCWIKAYEKPKDKRIYPRRIEKEYAKKIYKK